MKLKIYSDRSYLLDGVSHSTIFYPFWGHNPDDATEIDAGRRYDRYCETGASFLEMVPLADADVAVLPSDWELDDPNLPQLAEFAASARRAGKPVAAFFWGDLFDAVPLEGAVILRTSLNRSTRQPTEFAVPVWSEDFVAEYLGGQLTIRTKSPRPTVGFCGFADPLHKTPGRHAIDLLRRVKAVLQGRTGHKSAGLLGRRLRTQAMRLLLGSSKVDTDFVIRDRFWAGAVSPDGTTNLERLRQVRVEYLHNILNTDYTLCVRGAGNFSYRLYETLSCGRIPLFINTDSVLPYDFAVDWKQYCVWVDQSELPHIAEKLADFHAALSPQQFMDLQHACREFWEGWLSPHGFFANFYRHFAPVNP